TSTGWLPTGLMLMGLAYNAFLCFHHSLFHDCTSASKAVIAVKTLIQTCCIWILTLAVIPFILMHAFGQLAWPQAGFTLWAGVTLFTACSLLGLASAYVMVRDGDGTPLPLDQTRRL